MPDRSRKRPRDVNQLAKFIVDQTTGEGEPEPEDTRDPLAVELGRRGGLKGGKARAEKLTQERRSEIARKAAAARWRGDGGNRTP
jgi:hypothetical protein